MYCPCPAGRRAGLPFLFLCLVAVFSFFVSRAFLSRLKQGVLILPKKRRKKGGVDELKKLRSGAKRNEAILPV